MYILSVCVCVCAASQAFPTMSLIGGSPACWETERGGRVSEREKEGGMDGGREREKEGGRENVSEREREGGREGEGG